MSTAMQMGGQAVQAPAQLAGMVTSAPQGVMQGAQGAVQQISQVAGQVEKSDADKGSAPPAEQFVEQSERPEEQPPLTRAQRPARRLPSVPPIRRRTRPATPIASIRSICDRLRLNQLPVQPRALR